MNTAPSTTPPSQREVTFTNANGETFHATVFPPRGRHAHVADSPPVLFCVHGAGMSGDSFFRLAGYLQREGSGSCTASLSQAAPPPRGTSHSGGPTAGSDGPPRPHNTRVNPSPPPPLQSPPRPTMAGIAGDCAMMPPLQPDPHEDEIAVAVITFDLRCHGDSTFGGGEENLTLGVLTDDFRDVLQFAKAELFPSSDFYVLGHSLGGSIVAQGLSVPEAQSRIAGVMLVDVVEGTSKVSLKFMHDFLEKRPDSFDSVKDAEQWFLRHGGMRNPEGAAVSVPPLLRQDPSSGKYVWKSDLHRMEGVWDGWFDGLDKTFVGLPFPKMLCLANAERLDTELTVAQMQGKFQFEIIGNDCGHYVMDDATANLGTKIMRFIKRIDTLTKKLKSGIKPGMPLHFNNTTIPAGRQEK